MRRFSYFIFLLFIVIAAGRAARSELIEVVDVPMRDGVVLKADVYLPAGDGSFPAVLGRTPYDRKAMKGDAEKFVERGIAFVAMDVRGRYDSGGEFEPFVNEARDGEDTLKWVLAQKWCSGRVAGHGGSYLGYTQWALKSAEHDGLAALVPIATTADMYQVAYRGGALNLGTTLGWASSMHSRNKVDPTGYLKSLRGLKHLPVIHADNKSGNQIDFFDNWVKRSKRDGYWEQMDVLRDTKKHTPTLLIAGWFDLFLGPQINDFTRKGGSIIIGPWDHSGGLMSTIPEIPENAKKIATIQPVIDGWYDHWLLDSDTIAMNWPEVSVYVMGANRWAAFDTWPPPDSKMEKWYLHSSGGANDPDADGGLSPVAPVDEPPDVYKYDPGDPTPGRGGAVLGTDMGPHDYAETDKRADILSYNSEPFESEFKIIGQLSLVVHTSTTACGTDFVGRLLDVTPEGVAIPLAEGITRTQALPGGPPVAGAVAEIEIDLWATAYTFMPGHRMRVDVASGAFPHWDRNLNKCDRPMGAGREYVEATQKIFHDAENPSHILLPVFSGDVEALESCRECKGFNHMMEKIADMAAQEQ